MADRLVVLHGWSDDQSSFQRISRWLGEREALDYEITEIRLGDYVSLDDDVTLGDIVVAMQRAWEAEGLPTEPRSVDLVLHSTGALVTRHWMTTYFQPETCPLHRLVMLGPANFGSPLAHKGRSFLGRLIKGRGEKRFQTGTHILKALEIASPYSWWLAFRDRLTDLRWYGPERILCTVLVGNHPYGFPASISSEDGSDGTVRVSTANLDCSYLQVDLAVDPPTVGSWDSQPQAPTAFGVMDQENHSTVAFKDDGPESGVTKEWLLRSLQVDDAGYAQHVADMAAHTDAVMARYEDQEYQHGFMNLVLRVRDDVGNPVTDYFLEFSASPEPNPRDEFAAEVHRKALEGVHAYGDDQSYRSFYLDITDLRKAIAEHGVGSLWLSINAAPEFTPDEARRQRRNIVGYHGADDPEARRLEITPEVRDAVFRPNRTVLVDLTIPRFQADEVFRFVGVE